VTVGNATPAANPTSRPSRRQRGHAVPAFLFAGTARPGRRHPPGLSGRGGRLVGPGTLLGGRRDVDMCGLGVGLCYGIAGGMLYWET